LAVGPAQGVGRRREKGKGCGEWEGSRGVVSYGLMGGGVAAGYNTRARTRVVWH